MIDELFDRNLGWATGKTRSDPDYFRRLAEQQAPRYLWLGCSDSRVPANDIVGLDPGEVFVHRNVGNVVHTGDMNLLSVLEFAVDTLQVRHIIVCGHYGCGGIRRAFEPPGGGGLVDHWLAPVREMCRRCAPDLARLPNEAARMDRACELNVELQLRRVAATPIVRGAWQRKQSITVHGWIYGLGDGLLRDLRLKLSSLDDAESLDRENDYAGLAEPIHSREHFSESIVERAPVWQLRESVPVRQVGQHLLRLVDSPDHAVELLSDAAQLRWNLYVDSMGTIAASETLSPGHEPVNAGRNNAADRDDAGNQGEERDDGGNAGQPLRPLVRQQRLIVIVQDVDFEFGADGAELVDGRLHQTVKALHQLHTVRIAPGTPY